MKWVVAGDRRVREQLARLLERAGHEVATCSLLDHALTAVNAGCDGLLLAPGAAWAATMDWLHETSLPARVPTVLVAPQCEAQLVLDAILAGARSVVLEMDAPEKILVAIESALESEPHSNPEARACSPMSATVAHSAADVFAALMDGRLAFCGEARHGSSLQLVLEEADGKPLRAEERRALELLLAGEPLKVIAYDLSLVVSSVWSLLDTARSKMRFRNRAELLTVMSALRS